MKILVTGCAGFIGFHVCSALLAEGHTVHGVDNCSDYYDVTLKKDRLALLQRHDLFVFSHVDIANTATMTALFADFGPDVVLHLAAQAGVRYSIINPDNYIHANVVGFYTLLECCRHYPVRHFVYASSSSVYGLGTQVPFSEKDPVAHPASLYAATKRSNELFAHAYSHLYGIPTTGLRFFTVYGPWGRPDMAPFIFTKAILEGRPIRVFNHGSMQRDFTYIDDISDGVIRALAHIPTPNSTWNSITASPANSSAPFELFNIGNNTAVSLEYFIDVLEEALGKRAVRQYEPMQPGDVVATYADIDSLRSAVGFKPRTSIEVGIPRFVAWYRSYYG